MDMGDTWPDAELKQVFFYLYRNPRLKLDDRWARTMKEFAKELEGAPWLIYIYGNFLPTVAVHTNTGPSGYSLFG